MLELHDRDIESRSRDLDITIFFSTFSYIF